MNKYNKYLINNIKGGKTNTNYSFKYNNINDNSYPLFTLPFKTCDDNDDNKKCYKNLNIKEAVDYWNKKIAIHFDNAPLISFEDYDADKVLNNLTKNIKVLISLGNKQSYSNPRPDIPSKNWIWLKTQKITKLLNKNMTPHMPNEWCSNNEKLDSAIKKNREFNLEWLSNEDIDNVLYQYENNYPDFKYLATVPIDWQKTDYDRCIIHKFTRKSMPWSKYNSKNNFCSFDLSDKSLNNKNIFAMVLNTDVHNKGGQHWFSLYIKLNKNKTSGNLFLYDSATGNQNTGGKYINQLIKSIKKKYNLTVYRNSVKSQIKSNSECGMYSLYFILCMLDADHCNNNNSCIDVNTLDSLYVWNTYFNNPDNKIPDTLVAHYRNILFNSNCNNVNDYDLEKYIS